MEKRDYSNLPEHLPHGKLAFNDSTNELFIGAGENAPLQKVTNKEIEDELRVASIDYSGEHHANLKDSMDANVDFVMGEFNSVQMTGEYITAQNTIPRHVKRAELKGHTEVNCIQEPSGEDVVLPYSFEDGEYVTINDTKESGALNIKLKGQTYQNILPEPTLRNEMQGKSMQRLNEGYDNIEVVDGVSKSAILKGQTLVNLVPRKIIDYIASSDWDGYCCLVQNSKQSFDEWRTLQDLKPNTKYYISCYVETFEDANNKDYCLNNPSVESIFEDSMIINGVGRYQWLSTTKSELTDEIFIVLRSQNCNARGAIKIKNIMIIEYQEGMENWSIPYFEGMQSVKMPVLTTSNEDGTKTNILHTPEEVVLRSLPDGVCDTLNLNTGEYIQRIGERTFDGSEDELFSSHSSQSINKPLYRYICVISDMKIISEHTDNTHLYCDKWATVQDKDDTSIGTWSTAPNVHRRIARDRGALYFVVEGKNDVTQFREYLSKNPITVQYELATPIVKTVDLSSHGNWEKVVLDGDENWKQESSFAHNNLIEFKLTIGNGGMVSVISDRFATGGSDVERIACSAHGVYIKILKSKVSNLDEFKVWLQQNPTTVWYQTTTTQDNSVREMLSFANGHLQVSSEVENSLLPSVQYEIPTKNSYHMDLMKTNTLYTMKAKSVSGTFTIDGTSYNVNANGTFTSPSSMTDKLLIMSNKTNEEVMLLEGNVVDKTIPYFKGIKSAFEGEDKIEVLSTVGKNLFDMNRPYDAITDNQATVVQGTNQITVSSADSGMYVSANFILDKDFFAGKTVTGSCLYESDEKDIGTVQISYQDGNGEHHYQWIKTPRTFTFPNNFIGDVMLCVSANNTDTPQSNTVIVKNIQLELGTKATTYEPSNTTKIPLLSPLRSLPNGVCDELIIDRLNHKAKLIQRIGYEVLNENTAFSSYPTMEKEKTLLFQTQNANPQGASTYCISDQFIHRDSLWDSSNSDIEAIMIGNIGKRIDFRISKAKVSTNNVTILQDYLSKEPITVLYQLNIPIITEIDLTSFPRTYDTTTHIYCKLKDSSISPVISSDNTISYPAILKPNTKYSIITNPTLNGHTSTPISCNLGGASIEILPDSGNCHLITTPSNLAHSNLTFTDGDGHKLCGGVMLLEGDKTGMMFNYFEGMKSVENPTVKVTNGLDELTESYKSNTLTIPTQLSLRSLPNGVCDTLDLITGEYVQRVWESVYNGDETHQWHAYALKDEFPDVIGFYCMFEPKRTQPFKSHYSGKLPVVDWSFPGNLSANGEGIKINDPGYVKLSIYKNKLSSLDVSGFKQWLSNNPIRLQYQLEEPITTKLDLQWEDGKLFAYDGTTHFLVDIEGGHLYPVFDVDVPVNLSAEFSRLRAEKEQLQRDKDRLENQLSLVTYHKDTLYSNVQSLQTENSQLKTQAEDLQVKSNVLELKSGELEECTTRLTQSTAHLSEGLQFVDSTREKGDLELLSSDFDLDFRLMEIEFALDLTLPAQFRTKEVRNMARTPYEMAKTLILGGKYDREDMEFKLGRYLKRGQITQEQHDELLALMEANDLM